MTPHAPPQPAPLALAADYFDGQQARPHAVRLTVQAGQLHIDGDGVALRVPLRRVSWPERQRHGARQAYLPGHGMLSHADAATWDAWAAASGLRPGWLVPWMQSWRGALVATVCLVVALWGGWRWGLPAAAHAVVAVVPERLDEQLGRAVLDTLDQEFLHPSQLPMAQQQAVRASFEQAAQRLARAEGAAAVPRWTLEFRDMRPRSRPAEAPAAKASAARAPAAPASAQAGNSDRPDRPDHSGDGQDSIANALALPGGTLVVTDAMVRLLADRPDVLVGVFGHELGHLQHRHGMRLLVQASLLAAASSLLIGDFSSVLAAAPVLLGQAAYSRRFEFEADQAAVRMLQANGSSPKVFGVLFERLQRMQASEGGTTADGGGWPTGLASHPPDAERMRRMTDPD